MTDTHHKERINQSARSFRCPDGITRLIFLENWYWDNLDWILTKGESIEDVISFCWNLAKDNEDDPEYEFKATLAYYIHRASRHYVSRDDDLANDDWYNPDFQSECCL